LKKTAIALVIATFALCNFAAFITRSGFFSSLHAFNQSPLGWMFLALMAGVAFGGGILLMWRRPALTPERTFSSILARESWIWIFLVLLILLALLSLAGTIIAPLSGIFVGQKFIVEEAFYNRALVPIGLLLLLATALAPLTRWGDRPTSLQQKAIFISAGAAIATIPLAIYLEIRDPIALAVAGLASFGVVNLAAMLVLDVRQRTSGTVSRRLFAVLVGNRRQYAGFLTHLGFISLAVGITGSSLGSLRQETVMHEGETYSWSGRSIRLAGLTQRNLSDKIVIEAQLEITENGKNPYSLHPAQNYYKSSNQWTAKTAIHSTWTEDFYTILHSGEGDGKVYLTFLKNLLMRWIWFGGCLAGLGVFLGLLPANSIIKHIAKSQSSVPAPHAVMSSANRPAVAAR
jgi:cytochrome c-type biogenesis protein CcmF